MNGFLNNYSPGEDQCTDCVPLYCTELRGDVLVWTSIYSVNKSGIKFQSLNFQIKCRLLDQFIKFSINNYIITAIIYLFFQIVFLITEFFFFKKIQLKLAYKKWLNYVHTVHLHLYLLNLLPIWFKINLDLNCLFVFSDTVYWVSFKMFMSGYLSI